MAGFEHALRHVFFTLVEPLIKTRVKMLLFSNSSLYRCRLYVCLHVWCMSEYVLFLVQVQSIFSCGMS